MKRGYKQTEVGMIPEDWEVVQLSRLADVRGGIAKNSNASPVDPIKVHYLRVANVQDGYLDLSQVSRIDLERSELQRYRVVPGDVLMNEGGDLDKLGRGAVWEGALDPCVHQNHVFVVRCKSTLLPEYLNVWTSSSPARRYFLLAGKQTTNLASISKSSLELLPVARPDIGEQQAIAEALSDVDGLLGALDRLIAKKRDLKQAAMQQLLTGQTRLPGFRGEWKTELLPQVCLIRGGKAHESYISDIGQFVCVNSKFVSTEGKERKYTTANFCPAKKNDILMVMSDLPNGRALAKAYLADEDNLYAVNQRICCLTAYRDCPQFLFYSLNRNPYFLRFDDGVSQTHLLNVVFQKCPIRLPQSIDEQAAIAEVLTDMDAEIAALEQRREKTLALKQAMMQELLTGRTRLIYEG